MSARKTTLLGDIGATNARFALTRPDGSIGPVRVFKLDQHPSLADVIAAYLDNDPGPQKPTQAVLAVAAPVTGDEVTLPNRPWTFSIEALRQRFKLTRLHVINDFLANALAVPHLGEQDRVQIGPGGPVADAPIGLIGPGTGLGVSALVPSAAGAIAVASEGGHVTMAPADERESAVVDRLRKRFDHVSAERVLSGPGLVNLYEALCEVSGVPPAALTAAQITDPQTGAKDAQAREATAMFCAMLGTVAGNLALTLGARGGIYIAGGIVPKLKSTFAQSAFRARFEGKGRSRHYLAAIPTYVITCPYPALIGAAKVLERPRRNQAPVRRRQERAASRRKARK